MQRYKKLFWLIYIGVAVILEIAGRLNDSYGASNGAQAYEGWAPVAEFLGLAMPFLIILAKALD